MINYFITIYKLKCRINFQEVKERYMTRRTITRECYNGFDERTEISQRKRRPKIIREIGEGSRPLRYKRKR
jgi:hypothetical protein